MVVATEAEEQVAVVEVVEHVAVIEVVDRMAVIEAVEYIVSVATVAAQLGRTGAEKTIQVAPMACVMTTEEMETHIY